MVVPLIKVGVPLMLIVTSADVSARRSACAPPPGFGELVVVMSTMRKRKAVTGCPVLFVNLRRIVSVPCAPFVTAVRSRTRLGDADETVCGSTSDALICALRCRGLLRFSGPGAPSTVGSDALG